MRTIKKILEYDLTSSQIDYLKKAWIINWCWWEWWFNIEPLIKDYIENISWYDKEKWKKLFEDIRQICYEHDIDFRFKRWFYYSNYIFAKKIYKLFHKLWNQFKISFLVFVLLNKYWKKYYIY